VGIGYLRGRSGMAALRGFVGMVFYGGAIPVNFVADFEKGLVVTATD